MSNKEKKIEDVNLFAKMVAKKQNWQLNRDNSHLDMVLQGLMTNFNRYGYYACPCRDSDGEKEEDKDVLCPCTYSKMDIDEFGHCYCGLFLSKNFFDSKKEPVSIPERRNK